MKNRKNLREFSTRFFGFKPKIGYHPGEALRFKKYGHKFILKKFIRKKKNI